MYINNVDKWITDNSKISYKEKEELIKNYKNGNISLRNEIIESYLPVVISVVSKFNCKLNDSEDLLAIGSIGLIKGIDTLNIEKSNQIITYLYTCIRNEVLMYLRKQKSNIIIESLDYNNEDEYTLYEKLAKINDSNFAEELEDKEIKQITKKSLSELEVKDKDVILYSYGFKNDKIYTTTEMGKMFNVSQRTITNMRRRAEIRLKEIIENNYYKVR